MAQLPWEQEIDFIFFFNFPASSGRLVLIGVVFHDVRPFPRVATVDATDCFINAREKWPDE